MIGFPYISSFANFRNRTYFRRTAFPKKAEKAASRCCRCSSTTDPHHVRFDWPITNFSCNVEKYFENNVAILSLRKVCKSMIVTTSADRLVNVIQTMLFLAAFNRTPTCQWSSRRLLDANQWILSAERGQIIFIRGIVYCDRADVWLVINPTMRRSYRFNPTLRREHSVTYSLLSDAKNRSESRVTRK